MGCLFDCVNAGKIFFHHTLYVLSSHRPTQSGALGRGRCVVDEAGREHSDLTVTPSDSSCWRGPPCNVDEALDRFGLLFPLIRRMFPVRTPPLLFPDHTVASGAFARRNVPDNPHDLCRQRATRR